MKNGIKEILESGQFPGVSIKSPIRRVTMVDAQGNETRYLSNGAEDSETLDPLMMKYAEADGVDLRTARYKDVEIERGQGDSRDGKLTLKQMMKKRPGKRRQNYVDADSYQGRQIQEKIDEREERRAKGIPDKVVQGIPSWGN